MTVIRDCKDEASDVFPDPGSTIMHPLSVLPSLHRVQRDQFPGFISTMRCSDFLMPIPPHFVAFVWRYLNSHSFCSLPDGRVRHQGLELVTRFSSRDLVEETSGSPKFLGNLNDPFAHVPRRRRDC